MVRCLVMILFTLGSCIINEPHASPPHTEFVSRVVTPPQVHFKVPVVPVLSLWEIMTCI